MTRFATLCLFILTSLIMAPLGFATDATLATINFQQGQNREHCVGALAVGTVEQQIILNYQPGETTIVQITNSPVNTTNLLVRDVIGTDSTSRILTPGSSYNAYLVGSGQMIYYVIFSSGSGNLSVTRLK